MPKIEMGLHVTYKHVSHQLGGVVTLALPSKLAHLGHSVEFLPA
jgi:hypothetical protein